MAIQNIIAGWRRASCALPPSLFGRYGKGTKARLNLADCTAYELAMTISGRCMAGVLEYSSN
jgi:uncharacterized protein with PIN domain